MPQKVSQSRWYCNRAIIVMCRRSFGPLPKSTQISSELPMSNHDNTATQLLLSSPDFPETFWFFTILSFQDFAVPSILLETLEESSVFWIKNRRPCCGIYLSQWLMGNLRADYHFIERGNKTKTAISLLFRSERLILIFFLLIGKFILWHKISTNFSSIGNDHWSK